MKKNVASQSTPSHRKNFKIKQKLLKETKNSFSRSIKYRNYSCTSAYSSFSSTHRNVYTKFLLWISVTVLFWPFYKETKNRTFNKFKEMTIIKGLHGYCSIFHYAFNVICMCVCEDQWQKQLFVCKLQIFIVKNFIEFKNINGFATILK